MKWDRRVAWIREKRNAYSVLVGGKETRLEETAANT
jgi:hypothetical protein